MERKVIVQSNSNANVLLHPLVILNISDHLTRAKVQGNLSNPQVRGALLGIQSGRRIEVFNSFELLFNGDTLDKGYLQEKHEQLKQVFPTYEFLGWYNTCDTVDIQHINIHKQILELNDNPIFLSMKQTFSEISQEFPITMYESITEYVDEKLEVSFAQVDYKIESGESERIAIDHVAKVSTTGGTEDSKITSHFNAQSNAVKMLHIRISILKEYLVDVKSGKMPVNHEVLREISALCSMLPLSESESFKNESIMEYNDILLLNYLATMTKGLDLANELSQKVSSSQERYQKRQRW